MTRLKTLEPQEGDLKKAVIEYLEYGMNQGKWWFTPLNCGKAFVKVGDKYYAIQLCPAGTADILVIVGCKSRRERLPKVYFLELKSPTGKQTKQQKESQELVRTQGALYYVVRSIEEVMLLLYPEQQL